MAAESNSIDLFLGILLVLKFHILKKHIFAVLLVVVQIMYIQLFQLIKHIVFFHN